MAQDSIQRLLLCPGCKCLCANERLYICLGGHTICARCASSNNYGRMRSPSAPCCCSSSPKMAPRSCFSEANPFSVGINKARFFRPTAKSQTITYNKSCDENTSHLPEDQLEKLPAGRGDYQQSSEFTAGRVKIDVDCPEESHEQEELFERCCPACGAPITKIRNLVAENLTLIVANLGSFRSLPLECQRPAPAPSLPRPANPTAIPGIVKSMLNPPSLSVDPPFQTGNSSAQRRYCFVPKLQLNGEPQSIADSSEIDEISSHSSHHIKIQQQNPMYNDKNHIFPKKNYSPIKCPLSQCGRLTAASGFVHHFSFEHSDVPLHELRPGERMRATIVPSAIPVGMARVAVLYLLVNDHNIAYNTLMPRRLSQFRNHLPVVLLMARMAGGDTWQEDALLVWLACLDDAASASSAATISAHQATAAAPRLAQEAPFDSLRLAQDPRSVMDRGNAVLIHAGLLRQLVRDKATFELSLLIQ